MEFLELGYIVNLAVDHNPKVFLGVVLHKTSIRTWRIGECTVLLHTFATSASVKMRFEAIASEG